MKNEVDVVNRFSITLNPLFQCCWHFKIYHALIADRVRSQKALVCMPMCPLEVRTSFIANASSQKQHITMATCLMTINLFQFQPNISYFNRNAHTSTQFFLWNPWLLWADSPCIRVCVFKVLEQVCGAMYAKSAWTLGARQTNRHKINHYNVCADTCECIHVWTVLAKITLGILMKMF